MQKFLTHIEDVHGSKYVVIKFDKNTDDLLSKFLDDLKALVGVEKFNTLISNQQARDLRDGHSHTHHATVVNVMDLGKLNKLNESNKVDIFMSQSIDDFKMVGLGTAVDDKRGNQTYFVVCSSDVLNDFRKSLGIKPLDFHITLGFADKDVFGQTKGKDSLLDV